MQQIDPEEKKLYKTGMIGFQHHRIFCIIGVLPEERVHEQEIYVDLKVQINFAACIQFERIEETISYVDLANICTELAQKQKYQLLEVLANAILDCLAKDVRIQWAWVRIKKPQAIPTAEYAMVELERQMEGL